jgi:hypothetical protein
VRHHRAIWLAITILADGNVGDVQVMGQNNSFAADTISTVKLWKFRPAMCGDQPVVSDLVYSFWHPGP